LEIKRRNIRSLDVINIYDSNYFLNTVDGYVEFNDFNGEFSRLFRRYQMNINLIDLTTTDKYLEFGCGRGEIVIYHTLRGGYGVGVDFSSDAIQLARQKAQELGCNCRFINCSFADVPEEEVFDKIIASEFIEHISVDEGRAFLRKAYNLLKPGGKLLIYTHPNTLQRRYGYNLLRIYKLIFGRKLLPKHQPDTTGEHYLSYHLNEQNYITLNKLLKESPFEKYKILYTDDNFSDKGLIGKIIKGMALRHLFCTGLTVVAEK